MFKKSLLVFCLFISSLLIGANRIYGPISKQQYLLGKFSPHRNKSHFVKINRLGIPTNGRTHYLRKETARALKRVIRDFKKAHPRIRLYVTSSTRTYWQQKAIWEAKWNGRRKVGGGRLPKTHPNFRQRALKILEFSSMPGTSRHHWGTEVDFNTLNNRYYSRGKGKIIYRWLKKNMKRYDFCQPYTAGRKRGYEEEKWHWTYLPLAKTMTNDWLKTYGKSSRYAKLSRFDGSSIKNIEKLARIYVESINPACR